MPDPNAVVRFKHIGWTAGDSVVGVEELARADGAEHVGYTGADVDLEATTVQDAVDEVATQVADQQALFVFDPSGASAENVYTTWAALYADLSALAPEIPKTVFVASAATIPSGTYDLTNVSFTADYNTYPTLTLASGAVASALPLAFQNLTISSAGATPFYTGQGSILLDECYVMSTGGPMLRFNGGALSYVRLFGHTVLTGDDTGVANIDVDAASTLILFMNGDSQLGANAISDDGTCTLNGYPISPAAITGLSDANLSTFTGTVNPLPFPPTRKVRKVSTHATITYADDVVWFNTSGGARNANLPAANAVYPGFCVTLKKTTGDANTVTAVRNGSDTINGAGANFALSSLSGAAATDKNAMTLQSDGVSAWEIVATARM